MSPSRSPCKRRSIGLCQGGRWHRGVSLRATWVRSCESAAATRSHSMSRTVWTRRRPCIGTDCWCLRTLTAALTIRSGQAQLVTRDHDQAARGNDLVPSAPAREHGPAGLFRPCRHDDRERRSRQRARYSRNLRHRRSADRAPGQALWWQWRGRLPAGHDRYHAWLPGRYV